MGLLDRAVDKLKAEQKVRVDLASERVRQGAPVSPKGHATARDSSSEHEAEASIVTAADQVQIDLDRLQRAGFIVPGRDCDAGLLDEYRRIKRQLLFKAAVELADEDITSPCNLLMVTSALDGEGKTFVSLNLAFSISLEVDWTVLFVDADVIRRGATRMLGLEDRPGLIDYLAGRVDDIADVIVRPEGLDNIQILPAGRAGQGVDELIASERMRDLLDALASDDAERMVVFDTAPLLMTNVPHTLMPMVGQIAVVVRADKTSRQSLEEALASVPPDRFSGLVLNGATRTLGDGSYRYGYYDE